MEPILTCEECETKTRESEGITFEDAGIFVCDTCYDAQIDADFAAMQDAAGIWKPTPEMNHLVEMQAQDPVAFYLACKDDPDSLDIY